MRFCSAGEERRAPIIKNEKGLQLHAMAANRLQISNATQGPSAAGWIKKSRIAKW